ncbi:MAG: recombinase family protein [Actinomycetota bacterium]|nr:recombinase family protein [Actinomycetota bacterium]
MRIATYTRISTDEATQPYSLEAQRERLAAYAKSQEDWRIVRRFSDQASGASLERPGLERALQEAEAKRFDLLLVYRVDRLSRSVRGLAQLLEQLEAAGVGFRSASEPFDTTNSAGRMMVQMLGVFAEFERATIVERVIAGMERKAARGEWNGGSVPFGYRVDPERRFLEPEPAEAVVVQEIFERYGKRLEGTQTLARWLSDRGYRTKQGKPFNPQAVLTILRNRAYLGEISYRGQHHPAPHPPLVDEELFTRAGQILQERGEDCSLRRSNQSDYLLTGLVKCAHCGKRYVGAAANGKGGRYPYYVCFTRQRYGRQHCDGDRLPAGELEDAILAQLHSVLEQEPLVRQAIEEAFAELEAARPKREADLARLEAELRKTNEALERYFRAFEEQTLPAAACGSRIEELTEKLRGLEARREELSLEDEDLPEPLSEEDLQALAAQVREVVEQGDRRQQKALLQGLVQEIKVISREEIYPFFFVPAFRPPSGSVPPARIELAHAVWLSVEAAVLAACSGRPFLGSRYRLIVVESVNRSYRRFADWRLP